VLLGELFTPSAKHLIAPVGKGFNLFLAFLIGLIFPIVVDFIGISSTFFIFLGFSLLLFVYTYYIIPETKGKSFAEIQKLLS
jgi:MFS transporter, SP family, major inositol transporter